MHFLRIQVGQVRAIVDAHDPDETVGLSFRTLDRAIVDLKNHFGRRIDGCAHERVEQVIDRDAVRDENDSTRRMRFVKPLQEAAYAFATLHV